MFITLTHSTGRALLNVEKIIGVIEHEGKVYIASEGATEPLQPVESYDEIMSRIEHSKGKVI